jgi:hypothetical protein
MLRTLQTSDHETPNLRYIAPTPLVVALALAGCGSSKPKPTVCHVYPSSTNLSALVCKPAGCQHNLKHETLDTETTPMP